MAFTSYSVDNDRLFRNKLEQVRAQVDNLTIPLTLISKDFYKSQMAIFLLKSAGQYPDFKSEKSRQQKKKAVGFDYPLLKRSGALMRSETDPKDKNAINEIINGTTLIIGTRVEYGIYHQSDLPRKKLPLRKHLFIGPESIRYAVGEQKGRLERWVDILDGFLSQKLQQLGKVSK